MAKLATNINKTTYSKDNNYYRQQRLPTTTTINNITSYKCEGKQHQDASNNIPTQADYNDIVRHSRGSNTNNNIKHLATAAQTTRTLTARSAPIP